MVLDLRLIPLAALAVACSAAPDAAADAAQAAPAALDRARIGNLSVELVSAGDGCALRAAGKVHALGLPAPCGFLRRGGAAAATVEDYGAQGRVLMVIGPPAPASDYRAGMAETPADKCASVGRPVLERGGRLALGEVMRSPAGYCPRIGMDEKFYYGIAHDRPFADRPPLG